MSSSAPKPGVQIALEPARLLHFLASHARLLALCAAGGLALAAAFLFHRSPVYVSEALLEVTEEDAASLDFGKREASDRGSAALLKTIEQTVASQAVLRQVIADLALGADPDFAPPGSGRTEAELIALLRDRIRVGLVRGTRLIQVSARDGDPLKARRLAQAVIDGFFHQRALLRREGAGSAHAFLLAEARRLEQEVRSAEERLQAYQEKYNAVSLNDRQNIVLERLGDLGRQVTQARSRRLASEATETQIRAVLETAPEDLVNLREIAALPDIIELRRQSNLLQADLARLGLRYRDKHPSMTQARRQLEQVRSSLRATLVDAGRALLQSHRAALENEQALERELARQQTLAMELSRLAIDYRALERQARSTDALYQQVLARLKTSDLSQSLVAASGLDNPIQIVEQPLAPVRSTGAPAALVLVAGLAGGLGLGGATAVCLRAFDSSFRSIDDAESTLGLPSLAVVPRSSLRDADLVLHTHPATLEAESFRSLRTSLSLLFPAEPPRTVLFTSAVPGEGKSYCSANYAAALAQQGARTLLLDADLRRPSLRARLAAAGPASGPGLADCLRDHARFAEAVRPTRMKNLFVVGELQGSARNAEALATGDFKSLLDLALAAFNRVVIDTAPLTAVGDASAMAPHAAAVCLVVHAGRTPRRLVLRACVLLGRPPAGVVLNQIRTGRSARHDYYSHAEDYVRAASALASAP